jgi:hypothetical protein
MYKDMINLLNLSCYFDMKGELEKYAEVQLQLITFKLEIVSAGHYLHHEHSS